MSKPNPPTGARAHPAPPMPSQHLQKPGDEGAMALPPQYQAPDYQGSDKLAGMAAIVTGEIPASAARSACCSRAKAPMSPSSI